MLYEKAAVDPAKIPELVQSYEKRVTFTADSKAPYFVYRLNYNSRQKGEDAGEVIAQFLDRAQETLAGGNKKHYNEASDTGKEP